MRLSFPNGEHSDVVVDQGQVRLGAAPDNDIVVTGAGLADHHASLVVDAQRGIVLRLFAAAHVNARPIQRLALLRLGDVLSLGGLQVLVKPDRDTDIRREVPRDPPAAESGGQSAAARVVLRGVAGPLFGRSFPLTAPITLGRGADADVRLDDPSLAEHHARLEPHADRVVLRDLGSSEGSVVNGVGVRDAVLHPGDQIALEHHRFVLEAPGLPPRGSGAFATTPGAGRGITQTMQAVSIEPGHADGGGAQPARGRVGSLIAVAVLIMLLLAALLFYAPTLLT